MEGLFVYIFSGWEGSAADSRVLQDAVSKDFVIPPGKYYLADAGEGIFYILINVVGYALSPQFLTPYRGVRYHLKEWAQVPNARPANFKELFNLRHSSLRNIIERAFGIIKRRYKILASGSEYSLETQIKLFPACATLHNFIVSIEGEGTWNINTRDDETDEEEYLSSKDDSSIAVAQRDVMAEQMWSDYLLHRELLEN